MSDAAQIPPDPQRACYTKLRYGSEADAKAKMADVFRKRRTWLRAYACETCGGWHLTHKGALPPAGSNWRPPAPSNRQLARDRKRRGRRRR